MKTKPTGVPEALQALPLKIPESESTEPSLHPPFSGGTGNPVSPALPPGLTSKSADLSAIAYLKEKYRNRSNSVKRKADTAASEVAAKTIRLAAASKSLVSMISDNKKVVENVMKEVSSEKVMDSIDSITLDLLTKISLGLEGNSKIVEHYVSELEGIKAVVNDLVDIISSLSPDPTETSYSGTNGGKQRSGPSNNSRSGLPQSPIGGAPSSWSQVVSKKQQRGKGDSSTAAVRDAERSVLIHNLNLGQSPILNPATISARITSALVQAASNADGASRNTVTDTGKELTADIMSLVTSMDLYGTGTRPCRIPGNPSLNGTFYTVPVKLSFQNKQTAQRVSELLKSSFKINCSVPYHRSLRTSMNLVREKVKHEYPSHQIMVNLEFAARSLEVKVRSEDTLFSNSKWNVLPKRFPLPVEALDPKLSEVSKIVLPKTPIGDGDAEGMDHSNVFSYSSSNLEKVTQSNLDTSANKRGKNGGETFKPRPGGLPRTPPKSSGSQP